MPKIRGIRFERVFTCDKSGFDVRQSEVTMEDGFIVAKQFAKLDKTHGDYMADTDFSALSERPRPDAPRKGVTHK